MTRGSRGFWRVIGYGDKTVVDVLFRFAVDMAKWVDEGDGYLS